MLIIENQQHFDEVREFARSVGAVAELQRRLDFLANFGGETESLHHPQGYMSRRRTSKVRHSSATSFGRERDRLVRCSIRRRR